MIIHPTSRLVILAAAPLALSVAVVFAPGMLPILLALDALLLALAGLDGLLVLTGRHGLAVQVAANAVWNLHRETPVQITLTQHCRAVRQVALALDLPRAFVPDHARHDLTLAGERNLEITIRCTPNRRGTFTIAGAHLDLGSRLGLWRRRLRLGPTLTIRVYPDLKRLDEYSLLARSNRLGLIGIRSQRRAGGDVEFERLRSFQPGDPLGRVDWRATARRDAPIVREFRTAQNQNLILMIDAGRMMTGRGGEAGDGSGIEALDRAIDAALMLAHVALGQGDRVGLIAYADGIRRFLPPRGSKAQMSRLIHALHDLEATPVESRHDLAFLHLERRIRQRSLTILITSILDEVNAVMIRRHLTALVGRHLPMAVVLRHDDVEAALTTAPDSEESLLTAGAAALVAAWRRQTLERLEKDGVLVVDAAGDQVTPELLNSYLKVKARALL